MATKVELEDGTKIRVEGPGGWSTDTEVRVKNKQEGVDFVFSLYDEQALELAHAILKEAYLG